MKRCAFIIALVFISTNVYAVDAPWWSRLGKKPAEQKDNVKKVVVEKAKPAAPAKVVVVAPIPPVKKVVVNPAPPVTAVVAVPRPAPAIVVPQQKLTKAEIITRINELLKNRPNIVSAIQGLQEEPAGGYTYNGKKIEELDENTLFRILVMINQQISLDNLQKFDRQQRQLKNLQQIDRINRTQRELKKQQALTKPAAPKIYTPPKKIYTPPKIPRTRY